MALWKKLNESKPDENYEDPKDLAAIRNAERNLGDYKLKTGAKYIVPEHERINAEMKHKQIQRLALSIRELKQQFNARLFPLADKRKQILTLTQKRLKQLKEINQELSKLGLKTISEPTFYLDVIFF